MSQAHIITGDLLRLYSFAQLERPIRISWFVRLPSKEFDRETVFVMDYKPLSDGKQFEVTYQMRRDPYAPIFTICGPAIKQETPLSKPNKSRNWEWNTFDGSWRNKKTGERVRVYD